ncbi:hypothetical protein BAMA_04950 [Bacillus manliponensis]|uniref:Helix-turn-helix domain-containing protein n=1 Tax=Bacillus manliponensis TaxID=574376 RepID=A0A073K8K7_9BACI|nr:hypothetical protein [Bacillus manliponensis]KEK18598.1 hypothetical protein BAMA_04950 [Bacillus manliponensis]
MKNSVILSSQQFRDLREIKPYFNEKKQLTKLKNELYDRIKVYYGDRWYLFKKEVQAALQDLCFKSQERGVCYYQPDKLATKYGIGVRTIRRRLAELISANIILVAYCRNTKGNSRKKSIYFFTTHPYFPHWKEAFGLELNQIASTNGKNDDKKENHEKPDGSKGYSTPNTYTYILPKYIFNHSMSYKNKFYRYVPKLINQMYSSIFEDKLIEFWKRVLISCNKASIENGNTITKKQRITIARESLQMLHRYISYKHNMLETLSFEDECKILYTIAYKKAVKCTELEVQKKSKHQETTKEISNEKVTEEWTEEKLNLKRLLEERINRMKKTS